MISKLLISEVLLKNVEYVLFDTQRIKDKINGAIRDSEVAVYFDSKWHYINIYELAHKCKEFAETKGYSIMSRPKSLNQKSFKARAFVILDEEYKMCTFRLNVLNFEEYQYEADTEPEAIFKACQWILDNK